MNRPHFETLLSERRRALIDEIHVQLKQAGDVETISLLNQRASTDDKSVADVLADRDISMVTRDVAEPRDLEAVRARMADGSYGICIDCGRAIAQKRRLPNGQTLHCLSDRLREAAPGHQRLQGCESGTLPGSRRVL